MDKRKKTGLAATRKSGFFYGYVLVVVSIFIFLVMQGTFTTFGVFFKHIIADFGWMRATLSGAHSLTFFMMGSGFLIGGALNDRFDSRIIMTAGALLFGAGLLLMSRVDEAWQVYVFYPLVGLGNSASDIVLLSIIARWFTRRRGIMTGIAKAGTGLGILIISPAASLLILSYGWRNAYMVLALAATALIVPAALLLKGDPRKIGVLPDGEKGEVGEGVSATGGLTFQQAVRTWQLWTMCAIFATFFFCIQVVMVHLVPHATDMGIPETAAATLLSTIGVSSIFGRLVVGYLCDRIGTKSALIVCFLTFVASFAWLLRANELWMLYLFAVVYGFDQGGFISVISPLIAGLFDTRSHGAILGTVMFLGSVGGSVGPVTAGYIFDLTGSYNIAFIVLVVLAAIGLALSYLLRPVAGADGGQAAPV